MEILRCERFELHKFARVLRSIKVDELVEINVILVEFVDVGGIRNVEESNAEVPRKADHQLRAELFNFLDDFLHFF